MCSIFVSLISLLILFLCFVDVGRPIVMSPGCEDIFCLFVLALKGLNLGRLGVVKLFFLIWKTSCKRASV